MNLALSFPVQPELLELLLALLGGARKRWAMSMWNGRKTVRMDGGGDSRGDIREVRGGAGDSEARLLSA